GVESGRVARGDPRGRRRGDRRGDRRVRSGERGAIDPRKALVARARVHPARRSVSASQITRRDHLSAGSHVPRRAAPCAFLGRGGRGVGSHGGAARAHRTTRVREYLDRGFVVAGGTDSAVVPYPPLWVIYHFVTRDTISGGVMGAEQKISRKEALQIETINNAYLTFEESIKGSIEPGKLRVYVVLPADILTCPEKHIEQMPVSMTMVGGRVVYDAARKGLRGE